MTGFYLSAPAAGVSAAVGLVIGDLWLSCDLDGERSNAKRRWGPLRCLWFAYEYLPHRSPLSHWPGLGDLIRVDYLLRFPLYALMAYGVYQDGLRGFFDYPAWLLGWIRDTALTYPTETAFSALGLALATALHGIADAVVSEGKKMIDK